MKTLCVFAVLCTLLNAAYSRSIVKRELDGKRVVCYYTNWSGYRPEGVRFTTEDIDPEVCTHLLYAFALPNAENNTIAPSDAYQDIVKGGFQKFVDLKKKNSNLKTMLSLGGWNEGSTRFSDIASNATRRSEFVANSIKFLREVGFDGLDLVWQYPTFRHGSRPEDKENYALLIKELKEGFEKEAKVTGNPRLLLSVVISGLADYMHKGFDKDALNKYADFINVVAYDYYTASGPVVNHHSALYPLGEEDDDPIGSLLNVDASVKALLEQGYLPEKLNMGIPSYGRLFMLEDPNVNDIGSPAVGGGMGNTTTEAGYMPYFELCESIRKGGWTVKQQNDVGPYAFNGPLWIGFEDETSAKKKGEYAKMKGLGGIMFWTIDDDDFLGRCQNKKYPLIKAGREGIST